MGAHDGKLVLREQVWRNNKEQVVNTIHKSWTFIVLQFSWHIRQQRYTEGLIALREQKWIFIGVVSHVHVCMELSMYSHIPSKLKLHKAKL